MKKIVITGASGFVASHFIDYLYKNNIELEIYGIGRNAPKYEVDQFSDKLLVRFYELDLTERDKTRELLNNIKPDYLLHLAAFSSVAYSWKYPEVSFTNNCNIFLNVVEAIRNVNPLCRILSVGSSEEYGKFDHRDLPLCEYQPLNPISPYAVARVSQEQLAKVYVESYGMNIVLTRSFNHIGPRQDVRFVVPSFIERIMRIKESGQPEGIIETGDLNIIRDFIDVRDVVEAYYVLLMKGLVGNVYNVCSGIGVSLRDIVDLIAELVDVKVSTKTIAEYLRPNDIKEIVGSCEKIERSFGWKKQIPLRTTIEDMIRWQRNKL